jgi:putative membrane protein
MTPAQIRRVARVDIWYGILAAAILAVGFARANFAGKGWEYYSTNHFFWAKIVTFALVGLLSIYPTVKIIRWRRNADSFASSPSRIAEVNRVRRVLWLEAFGLGFIVAFAAAMARGYGSL